MTPRDEHPKLSTDAKHLKDVTNKLLHLRLDHTEFTCLKALSLFKPGMIIYSHEFTNIQGQPLGIDIMYLVLTDRNIQVRFGLKVVWES